MGFKCAADDLVIPVFPTRKWIQKHLGLSVEEVKRMDAEKMIRRHPGFGSPVKYYGESVREFIEGRPAGRR